tara:strand:+ start:197 stop:520 length:324 start_codon:yes stop_codon:yes gene_type:complete
MAEKRRIVRKKKKNEASEALAKVSGVKELEIAATILKELAERKQRKEKIEGKIKTLEKIKKERPKKKKISANIDNDKIKRLKELETLQKTGILTEQEFEKLKIDLLK